MTGESWRVVEAAFLKAIELEGIEQAEFLSTLEAPLRIEVEGMLKGHAAGDFLREDAGAAPAPGMRAGPYRLVDLIGEGGMGIVYRAERADDQFRKQVAVKLIRSRSLAAGTGTEALSRFRVERQILALLEHVNIVRLFDAGVTDQGAPYFVMELVEGQPITSYCASHQLDIPARLQLFQQVCAAIDHAHRHQVIHRDIKPANLLVTDEAQVKVLDFGIAKLLAPLGGESVTTQYLPLTPDYASPEHLKGQPVTTASDIFSLGLVLYELITGTKARPGPTQSLGAGRDLDSIFLKATAEAPDERYASAGEFARDVGRFLSGQPVLARQATIRYLITKAVKRNRGKVVASLLILAIGGGFMWWQSHQVELERQRRYTQVREVARTMIIDMQTMIRDVPNSLETRKKLLAQALGYLESLRKEANGDSVFESELGFVYLQMANLQAGQGVSNLGDASGAEASQNKAKELAESILKRDPSNLHGGRLMASYLQEFSLRLAPLPPETRLAAARKALEIRAGLASRYPGDFKVQKEYASAFQFVAFSIKDPRQVRELHLECARRMEVLLKQAPADKDLLRIAALAAKYIGGSFDRESKFAESIPYYERALVLDRQLLAGDPANRDRRMDISFDWCSIGASQRGLKAYDKAEAALRQCAAIRQQLLDQEPKDVRARDRLSYVQMLLAATLFKADQPGAALAMSEAALANLEQLFKLAPAMRDSSSYHFAYALYHRARSLDALKRPAQACPAFRTALKEMQNISHRPDSADLDAAQAGLASTCK